MMDSQVQENICQLGWDIITHLSVINTPPASTIISPLSITIALAMLAGAADARGRAAIFSRIDITDVSRIGSVYAEVFKTLRSSQLQIANGVFLDGTVKPKAAYLKLLQSFQVECQTYPDLAAQTDSINNWISQNTNELIKNVLKPDNLKEVELILINTLAFKGLWSIPFSMEATQKAYPFQVSANKTRLVDMMFLYGKRLAVADHEKYTAIRLEYKSIPGSPVMYLEAYLPSKNNSVQDILPSLKGTLEYGMPVLVDFGMPRFEAETTEEITPTLEALGYPLQGPWSEMLENITPVLGPILHKAIIKVDEEGTVAAAATVIMMSRCLPPKARTITLDRAFAYSIGDNTGMTYFTGVFA